MPLIEIPFDQIAMDPIRPIYPAPDSGNRYILTVVDCATRYPEAVAILTIEAERVADSLMKIYTCKSEFRERSSLTKELNLFPVLWLRCPDCYQLITERAAHTTRSAAGFAKNSTEL